MESITTAAPSYWDGVYRLSPFGEKPMGIWVHFADSRSLHKVCTGLPNPKQDDERWLKRFTMILHHDLDFHPVYTVTKGENLRTISSVNCINCLAFPSLAPAPSTRKGIGKFTEWTARYCLCYEHFQIWRNESGMNHSAKWSTRTVVLSMRRRGTRRIICCLEEHHAYPPT